MGDVRTEPSMEEILASIKRIIADDGLPAKGGLNGTRAVPRPDVPAKPDGESGPEPVLELTEAVVPQPVATRPTAPLPATAAEPVAEAPAAEAPSAAPAAPPAATLVSSDAAGATRQSLAALSSLVVRPAGGEVTLDGMVREMLRPILKDWLDAHLPAIVEKLVAREIARISAGDD